MPDADPEPAQPTRNPWWAATSRPSTQARKRALVAIAAIIMLALTYRSVTHTIIPTDDDPVTITTTP